MSAARNETRRVAIYVRVSTGEQTTDNQLRELRAVARRSRWKVVEVYKDQDVTRCGGPSAAGPDRQAGPAQVGSEATTLSTAWRLSTVTALSARSRAGSISAGWLTSSP